MHIRNPHEKTSLHPEFHLGMGWTDQGAHIVSDDRIFSTTAIHLEKKALLQSVNQRACADPRV